MMAKRAHYKMLMVANVILIILQFQGGAHSWFFSSSLIRQRNYHGINLTSVSSLTFTAGKITTFRRTRSFPQLHCSGGTAGPTAKPQPSVVVCNNTGTNGSVTWHCGAVAGLDQRFVLGESVVNCEGFEGPNDVSRVLEGSCFLSYELDFAPGANAHAGPGEKPSDSVVQDEKIMLIFFGVLTIVMLFLIALVLLSRVLTSFNYFPEVVGTHGYQDREEEDLKRVEVEREDEDVRGYQSYGQRRGDWEECADMTLQQRLVKRLMERTYADQFPSPSSRASSRVATPERFGTPRRVTPTRDI